MGQGKPGAPADPKAAYWTYRDIAAYTGLTVRTLQTYRDRAKRKRSDFPEEDTRLGNTPVWRPSTIIRWWRNRAPGESAGAPRKLSPEQAAELVAMYGKKNPDGAPSLRVDDIAKHFGISRDTVYRYLDRPDD